MRAIFFVITTLIVLSANANSPYSGQEAREIKALSASDIESYLRGDGMGYAKAGELNHYPGPRHVLELADELGLSAEQRQATQAIFTAMKEQASTTGKQLVDLERRLDRLFAEGLIESETLRELLTTISELEAKLRFTHLNAHLSQRALLTQHQTMRYDLLRGYDSIDHTGNDHAH